MYLNYGDKSSNIKRCSTTKILRNSKITSLFLLSFQLPQYGCKPELVSKYFEESLRNLKVDYIDLYLIHMPFYLPEVPQFDEHGKVKIIDNDFVAVWKVKNIYVSRNIFTLTDDVKMKLVENMYR